jgi:hypothetical protein
MSPASAIADSEYWAAPTAVAGPTYGDWADSVVSERLKSPRQHFLAMRTERNDPRTIPRGEHVTKTQQDCSAEGIACTQFASMRQTVK